MRAFATTHLLDPGGYAARPRSRVTARRAAVRGLAPAVGASGVDSIMRTDVVCLREEDALDAIHHLFVDGGADVVPVVDREGCPRGVITKTDLLRGLAGDRAAVRTAGQVMTSFAFTLPATASADQAAALMAYEGVEQLIITDDDGAVVGVVTALDIARRCARVAGYLVDRSR